MSQSRLDAYLDQVEQHLTSLPERERWEWRREAAQHLGALADAEEELGLDRVAAEEAAIRRLERQPRTRATGESRNPRPAPMTPSAIPTMPTTNAGVAPLSSWRVCPWNGACPGIGAIGAG